MTTEEAKKICKLNGIRGASGHSEWLFTPHLFLMVGERVVERKEAT